MYGSLFFESVPRAFCASGTAFLFIAAAACGSPDPRTDGSFSGSVSSDGSSTLLPVAEALAEEFQIQHPDVRVTVGVSGTGGGLQRFCAGEIDIANASRTMSEAERTACSEMGIDYLEVPVAQDGVTLVVHRGNDFASCLSLAELKRIWRPGSAVSRWRDVRPDFPATDLRLYGPGTDSGTFDVFTRVVNGRPRASRPDYQRSEDDNVIVQGVGGDPGGLGYFGFIYFLSNQNRLDAVAVDAGDGCVRPSLESIADGTYGALIRELLVYVNKDSLGRPEVRRYVQFILEETPRLSGPLGLVSLTPEQYQESRTLLEELAVALGSS